MSKKQTEDKAVVEPLLKYFLDPKRSGATWQLIHRPKYAASATGTDLHVARKNHNLDLLVEAKHVKGAFAASMSGLLLSPLVRKHNPLPRNGFYCWAIGSGYSGGWDYMPRMVQCLCDYFARNPKFWPYYSKLLRVKYIFFVDRQKKVAKISFVRMLRLLRTYDVSLKPRQKQELAQVLLKLRYK
jgi:hypothetical protein